MPRPDLILLLMDESPTRALLERALRAAGYTTLCADERAAADELLKQNTPALLVVGEKVKRASGLKLAGDLLERFPTLPILLYAEAATPDLWRQALKAGLSDCLMPPLRSDDIVRAVKHALERADHLGDWVRREIKSTTASLEKRVEEMETLVHLGRDLTGSLDLDHVLANVVAAAVRLTGAEEGSLLLLEPDGEQFYMRAGHNFEAEFATSFRLPVRGSLAGQALKSRKPFILNESTQKIGGAYVVHALIYVPLCIQNRPIGVLGVDNRQRGRPFSEHHGLLMTVLGDFAAIAIENARLYSLSEGERHKFEATFSSIEDGVLIVDNHGRILLINPAMRRAFNLEGAALQGLPLVEAIPHPDLRSLLQHAASGTLKYHEINFDDGRVFSAHFTPIPGIGAAITMQDVTYLKQLDRLKSEFVHTVSHDLRSPLTAVLGYTELLGRVGPLSEQQQEFVRRIQASVQSITALVNDLLDLGRIEAGFDGRRETVHLESILKFTLENLESQVQARRLQLQVSVTPDLSPVRGNPIRLRQVLDNLIGNAIKYTPAGGEVRVRLDKAAGQLIFQVSDTGPGIPPADQPHIFEKFYRGSNVPEEVGGSGLGLAIVKSIVDSYQGRIWFESTPGQGSTFFVVLPADESSRPSSPPA